MKSFSLFCFTVILFYPAILQAHGTHPHTSIDEIADHMDNHLNELKGQEKGPSKNSDEIKTGSADTGTHGAQPLREIKTF